MEHDWLFEFPRADLETQEQFVAERLDGDPVAAAIADEEAETFFTVAYLLRFLNPKVAQLIWKRFGVRHMPRDERAIRRATIQVLRHWTRPKSRELLTGMIPNTGFGNFPDVGTRGHVWTEELFQEAHRQGVNLVWLVAVRRHLGREGDVDEWLNGLSTTAARVYHMFLNGARLALRRHVYTEPAPPQVAQEVAAAEQATLVQDLKEKNKLSGTLRQDVRRLEKHRKHLKEQARKAELEARAMLSTARGEVAAARKALKERLAAHERELAQQEARFETELKGIQKWVDAARADFTNKLSAITHSPLDVLQGLTITMAGAEQEEPLYRLMVESLGGVLVPDGGAEQMDAPTGFAAFERHLRSLAMRDVQIKCDGLYRKKEGRPGIAMSGLQVRIGREVIYQNSHVVSCGRLAGSLMAEYGAAALALSWLLAAEPSAGARIEIQSDCRALLNRLHRKSPARRKPGCMTLDRTVRRLMRSLRQQGCEIRFRWVPRDEVHVVDRLCYHAYRDLGWYHRRGAQPRASIRAFFQSALHVAG